MKKFLFLLITLLVFFSTNSWAHLPKSVDEIAQKIAAKILVQLKRNKEQNVPNKKSHIVNVNELYDSDPKFYNHYVNNGSLFWNLSASDNDAINNRVNSYSSTFDDVEYIIVIGSIFKFDDLESDIVNKDWATLLKDKSSLSVSTGRKKEELKFFKSVKDRVESLINIQYPSNNKYIINWFLSVFRESGKDQKYTIETQTHFTNKSGYDDSKFSFASLDGQIKANSLTLSKKDWIIKNVDFDASTIDYIKSLITNVFFVNKSSKQITGNQFLKDLFEGKLSETENGTVYRNLKVILLVSDETTSVEDTTAFGIFTSQTHVVVRIHYVQNRPHFSVKYPTPQMNFAFSGFINAIDPRTFWQGFSDRLGDMGEDFCVVVYDVMDFLAKGIAKAKIPAKVWNCCDPKYKIQYESVFKYVLLPLNILAPIIDQLFNNGYGLAGCELFTSSRGTFAFNVGIWNGLVDIVEGIPTMIKLVFSAGIDEKHQINPATGKAYRNDWGILKDSINVHGGGLMGFVRVVGGSLKELHDPSKPCLLYHSVGSDVLMIVAAVLTSGESLASSSVGGAARSFFVALQKLDAVSQVIGKLGGGAAKYIISPVLTPVTNAVKQSLRIIWKDVSNYSGAVFEIVVEGTIEKTRTIIRIWDAATGVFKDFDWTIAKEAMAKVKAVNGGTVDIGIGLPNLVVNPRTLADDLFRLGDQLRLEIKGVIRNNDGSVLTNSDGQGFAIIKREGEQAGEEIIAVVDDVNSVANGVVDLSPELTAFAHGGEEFSTLASARNLRGTVAGNGIEITGRWLKGSHGNAGLVPKSVADRLRGRSFNNFDDFREAFWKAVAEDPNLASQFSESNITKMRNGLAPTPVKSQWLGKQKTYVLHHRTPIYLGGAVYDVDNLYIVTPKFHKEILTPQYHYGYGYTE